MKQLMLSIALMLIGGVRTAHADTLEFGPWMNSGNIAVRNISLAPGGGSMCSPRTTCGAGRLRISGRLRRHGRRGRSSPSPTRSWTDTFHATVDGLKIFLL